MKLTFKKTQSSYNLLRSAGYANFRNPNTRETSYTRRLGSNFYPRFHIYINREDSNEIELTLHLDQKKPSYESQTAHSGEYAGDIVQKEGERICAVASRPVQESSEKPRKGFWSRLFKK